MTVLTVGETMALIDPVEDGDLGLGMPLTLRFAGAESNFAIALARLGVPVRWVSRLGRDPLGDLIERGLTDEEVDVRWVRRDDAPTGLFLSGGLRAAVTSSTAEPARPLPALARRTCPRRRSKACASST